MSPLELLAPPVVDACDFYCRDFGRLVTAGGAAMDMIDAASVPHCVEPFVSRLVGASSDAPTIPQSSPFVTQTRALACAGRNPA